MNEEKRGPGRPPREDSKLMEIEFAELKTPIRLEGVTHNTLSKDKFSNLSHALLDPMGNIWVHGRKTKLFIGSLNVIFAQLKNNE